MGIAALKAVFLDRDGVLNQPVVRDGKPLHYTEPRPSGSDFHGMMNL